MSTAGTGLPFPIFRCFLLVPVNFSRALPPKVLPVGRGLLRVAEEKNSAKRAALCGRGSGGRGGTRGKNERDADRRPLGLRAPLVSRLSSFPVSLSSLSPSCTHTHTREHTHTHAHTHGRALAAVVAAAVENARLFSLSLAPARFSSPPSDRPPWASV